MYKQNQLENLEIKLKNAKQENSEVFEQVEKDYNEKYRGFVESFFKTDVLGAKKTISALFQLEYFNSFSCKDKNACKVDKGMMIKSLDKALEKWLKILPLKLEQKEQLKSQILLLSNKKEKFSEIFEKNTDFSRDFNYPVLEDLISQKVLSKSDMLSIYSNYQNTKDIRLSLWKLSAEKREIVTSYFYNLNSTKREEKVSNFSEEFSSEIKNLHTQFDWPIVDWVVSFVGRNFFKMKPYKKKIESKKLRLRRTFKIALLKLLRIKYSWFNVEKLLKQIDSLDDFESMFRLIQKLIEIIPENSELLEKYSVQEEVDEVEETIIEAEGNKEKILAWEEITIKASKIMSETEQKLDRKLLDKILDEDTDIVGGEVKFRKNANNSSADTSKSSPKLSSRRGIRQNWWNLLDWWGTMKINAWILTNPLLTSPQGRGIAQESEEDEEEFLEEWDLEQIYQELKLEYNLAEKKKQWIFASGDFDLLDEINEEILWLMVKLEKVSVLMGEE